MSHDEPTYACRDCLDEGTRRVLHEATADAIRVDRDRFLAGGRLPADVTVACGCNAGRRWIERYRWMQTFGTRHVPSIGLGKAGAIASYDAWRATRRNTWSASDFAAQADSEVLT